MCKKHTFIISSHWHPEFFCFHAFCLCQKSRYLTSLSFNFLLYEWENTIYLQGSVWGLYNRADKMLRGGLGSKKELSHSFTPTFHSLIWSPTWKIKSRNRWGGKKKEHQRRLGALVRASMKSQGCHVKILAVYLSGWNIKTEYHWLPSGRNRVTKRNQVIH